MGCTSSAPNMISPKLNTAEKSIQFEGDISDDQSSGVDEIIYRAHENDKNEINVLPSCDTVAEPINNLVRNKSSPCLQSGNGKTDHGNNYSAMNTDKTSHDDDKKAKLEKVVEKVVELYKENSNDEQKPITQEIELEKTEDKLDAQEETTSETGSEHHDEETNTPVPDPEETLSPTQSESSRATRWEALADIAAELPASLAVDPVTGQIYTLAK